MEIKIIVTHEELSELNVSRDHVYRAVTDALNAAVLPNGEPANFDAVVSIEWAKN
jgi:hypothetical protein